MAANPLRLLKSRQTWVLVVLFLIGWHFTAYFRGALAATIDGLMGHHEIQTYGYPAKERREYGEVLKERYGVRLRGVAGCVVSERLREYVRGYNTVVEDRFFRRYERDIFEECWDKAVERWRAKNPVPKRI